MFIKLIKSSYFLHRVTPETYQKFKANPPTRIKRKAERQRQEREAEEKKRKIDEERRAKGLPPLEEPTNTQNGAGEYTIPILSHT